jgi:hypothetical protein
MFQGEQNQLNRNAAAPGQYMNLANMPGQIMNQSGNIGMDPLAQLLNIGGQQRGITGEMNQEGAGNYYYEQPYNSPWIQALASLTSGAPRLDTIAKQNAPSFGSQMLPVLSMGLGGYFAGGGTLAGMGKSLFGGGGGGVAATYPYGTSFGGSAPWMGP